MIAISDATANVNVFVEVKPLASVTTTVNVVVPEVALAPELPPGVDRLAFVNNGP